MAKPQKPTQQQAAGTRPAAAQAQTPKPRQGEHPGIFLLAVFLYLLLTVTTWWCVNGMVSLSTGGEITLSPLELGFTMAYLVIAMAPAFFRLYMLATCTIAGIGLWRMYEFTTVLVTKTYETVLDLFSPLFYMLMAASLATGITLELRRRHKNHMAGQ